MLGYFSYFLTMPGSPYQFPYFADTILFQHYIEPTLVDLAMVVYVKKMNGRFYGVFAADWALSIGTPDIQLFLYRLGFEFYYFLPFLISIFKGISLWTSRELSKKPTLTALLAVLSASGYYVSLLIPLFLVGPFSQPAALDMRFYLLLSLDTLYSSLLSVLFILLFYLEIRRPSFAEMWDMQRSTISPQP